MDRITLINDADVTVIYEKLLEKEESRELFEFLSQHTTWNVDKHSTKSQYGTPRRVGSYTTVKGLTYNFVGNQRIPRLRPQELEKVWDKVEEVVGHQFNFVLINRYESGKHSLGWHSDKADNLVPQSVIASISLGEERLFQMKRKDNQGNIADKILENGSLLVMNYETQEHYLHRVPKSKSSGTRINLTFRNLRNYDLLE